MSTVDGIAVSLNAETVANQTDQVIDSGVVEGQSRSCNDHLRKARKEELLVFHSLLDKSITRMDDEKPMPKREAIRVE